MREFLTMCGYEALEIEQESARVRRALEAVGITDGDLVQAKIRIATYFDLELAGVRKMLGAILRDFTNTVLLREDGRTKVAFSFMAPGCQILGSAIMANYGDVGWANPNYTFLVVLGSIFDKAVPVMEAAERLWLRAGGMAHCGNVKCALGLIALDMIPKPDLAVTSGFLCESSSKTIGLIQDWYGIPGFYIDCWQDREFREYPDATRSTTFYAKSLRLLGERVGKQFGIEISDAMIWEVLTARKAYTEAKSKVQNLMRQCDPIPMGSTHLNLLFAVNDIPFRAGETADITAALNTLHEELLDRARRGIGATPKGAPRVLSLLPCHHSDPRWEHLADQAGVAIVASDFEFGSSRMADRVGVLDPGDPYDIIAQCLHSVVGQVLGGRLAIIKEVCEQLHLNGVLNRNHIGCRYLAGDTMTIRNVMARELGLPVLTLEWDNFDPRGFNHQQYCANLETFLAMMAAEVDHSGTPPSGGRS